MTQGASCTPCVSISEIEKHRLLLCLMTASVSVYCAEIHFSLIEQDLQSKFNPFNLVLEFRLERVLIFLVCCEI